MRLGPTGAPLQAESTGHSEGTITAVTPDTLVTLLDASRLQWLGVVDAPDGIAGLPFGDLHVPTGVLGSAALTGEGGTGLGQRGLDNQGVVADHTAKTFLMPGYETLTWDYEPTGGTGSGFIGLIPAWARW
ncbi:MAG: hypothetical protein OEY86_16205 [Nitrospira sp.]|nr:hypothetical protein [Nitrospira sp.]